MLTHIAGYLVSYIYIFNNFPPPPNIVPFVSNVEKYCTAG